MYFMRNLCEPNQDKFVLVFKLIAANSRYSPRVRFFISIVEGLDTFLAFSLAHASRVSHFEKPWSKLDKPLRVDSSDFTHIFAGS